MGTDTVASPEISDGTADGDRSGIRFNGSEYGAPPVFIRA